MGGVLALRVQLGPIDPRLGELGSVYVAGGFGYAVLKQDVDAAERALDLIEDRVVELKREA